MSQKPSNPASPKHPAHVIQIITDDFGLALAVATLASRAGAKITRTASLTPDGTPVVAEPETSSVEVPVKVVGSMEDAIRAVSGHKEDPVVVKDQGNVFQFRKKGDNGKEK